MKSILVIDDEAVIRETLKDYLDQFYEVHAAKNGEEALKRDDLGKFDLAIADINMPGMKGYELLQQIKIRCPKIRTALITAYDVDNYIRLCIEHGICNIIAKTVPFNFNELNSVVKNLISGEIFGLDRYMFPGYKDLGRYTIKNSCEARKAPEIVASLFKEIDDKNNDIKLVMTEVITNSLYHAPRNQFGQEKYEALCKVFLEEKEYIKIFCAKDEEKYGVSVTDYSGNLKKETVLEKIERHASGKGHFDMSGRGIYLSRCMADRMIFNIDPGRKTEIVLLYYFKDSYMGYKPIYINEL